MVPLQSALICHEQLAADAIVFLFNYNKVILIYFVTNYTCRANDIQIVGVLVGSYNFGRLLFFNHDILL